MARPSRINALERITLQAPPGTEEGLTWFYRDILELTPDSVVTGAGLLCFRSAGVELRIEIRPHARVERLRRRAVIAVPSLPAVAAVLGKQGIAFHPTRGLCWSDQRLALLDPGGNRIELKQQWPEGLFGAAPSRWNPADSNAPFGGKRAEKSQKSR